MRIGFGYDVHRLVENRKLVLGGVEIPYAKGLLGHSDADVLCHAIADALLSASNQGDIGSHFPDSDVKNKNISSLEILRQVQQILHGKKIKIINIDCTLVLEKPHIANYVEEMKNCIARSLQLQPGQITIKGKSTEGLGFTGSGEGVAAYSVALIEE